MQQKFFQVFRQAFSLLRGVIYIVFTIALLNDLSHTPHLANSPIGTGIALAAVVAALLFFDPVVEIVLLVSLIALVVLVAHGSCSNPTLASGVQACVTTAGELAFDAITDVIHRLLALFAHHSRPDIIESHLIVPTAPPTGS